MSVAGKTRENTASKTREHNFLDGNRGNRCVKKFTRDSMPPFQEKRRVDTRDRGERLQGIVEGTSSAPHLVISSIASFPGRNECLGTHCSLIEQEEREDSSCQICQKNGGEDMVARTEQESNRRRREEKWQSCWCCRDQQRACKMAQASAEELDHTGPAERKRVSSVPRESRLASVPEPFLQKGKQTQLPVQSTRSCGGGERIKMNESRTLAREMGITAGAWRRKGGLHSEGRQVSRR